MRINFRIKAFGGLMLEIGKTLIQHGGIASGFSREWVVAVLIHRFGDLPCLSKSDCYTPRLGKSSGMR